MLARRSLRLPHSPARPACLPGPQASLQAVASLLLATALIAASAQTRQPRLSSLPDTSGTEAEPTRAPLSPQQETRLANNYLAGHGVAQDPAQAAFWFRKAADSGDPTAQNNLGYLYLTGIGVDPDEAAAARWFARALAGGSQEGKLNLALIYLKGSAPMRDVSLALNLLNQLAEQHNAHAEDTLGVMYLSGDGVPRDTAAAEKWFTRAAKHGDAHARFALGALNSIEPEHAHDLPKAVKFLRLSAQGGYTRAMYILGYVLLNHSEISPKKPTEAVDMLTQAAEAGQWEASELLGVLARDGRGSNPDLATAFRWFLIEAKQGGSVAEQSAHQDLANCRQALSADQQEQELQAADQWLTQHSARVVLFYRDSSGIAPQGTFLAGNAHGD